MHRCGKIKVLVSVCRVGDPGRPPEAIPGRLFHLVQSRAAAAGLDPGGRAQIPAALAPQPCPLLCRCSSPAASVATAPVCTFAQWHSSRKSPHLLRSYFFLCKMEMMFSPVENL